MGFVPGRIGHGAGWLDHLMQSSRVGTHHAFLPSVQCEPEELRWNWLEGLRLSGRCHSSETSEKQKKKDTTLALNEYLLYRDAACKEQ